MWQFNPLWISIIIDHFPACEIKISSKVPIAAGLGSSASTAVALIRALIKFLGQSSDEEVVNQLAFNVEKTIHGNPSGVDNTVIAYEKPIFFIKDTPIEFLSIKQSLHFDYWKFRDKKSDQGSRFPVFARIGGSKIQFEIVVRSIGKNYRKRRKCFSVGELQEIGEING